MKKLFCVSALLAAVWIGSAAGAGLCARAYEVERTVISEKTAVIDGKPVEVRLSGVGKTYITEIRLDVLQGGKPVCSIVPPGGQVIRSDKAQDGDGAPEAHFLSSHSADTSPSL